MLHLQKASAGSGKTYTLTRTYIRMLIGERLESGHYRLRRPEEIRDAHARLLAITFTNKATNEMKQRIVAALAALAAWKAGAEKKPDYMQDFEKEFGEKPERIAAIAGAAISEILNAYSDFRISTIDSFFQLILRTFAYETELNDNYQVELDNDYMAQVGVDATLSQVRDPKTAAEVKFWLSKIIGERLSQGSRWNVFSKNASGPYDQLVAFIKGLDNENFKQVLPQLEQYMESAGDFRRVYSALKASVQKWEERRRSEFFGAVDRHLGEVSDAGLAPYLSKNHLKAIERFRTSVPGSPLAYSTRYGAGAKSGVLTKAAAKSASGSLIDRIETQGAAIYDAADAFNADRVLCNEVMRNFHHVGLLKSVAGNLREFREQNNLVQLSDTNSILRRIICDDDAPFIYERIGYYIHSFLIDEFQDTSALQWENLRPLINESLANSHDNLIIGDAKQSIYRFRNADSSLISTGLPRQMGDAVVMHGDSREENTNWRSAEDVVRFNNTVFSELARALTAEAPGDGYDFAALYGNIRQEPHHRGRNGYVEVRDLGEKEVGEDLFPWTGPLIDSMLARGRRQSDIAILVRSKKTGREIIDSLVAYNLTRSPELPPIRFVSEESLLIDRAQSVRLILSVLGMIAAGPRRRRRSDSADKRWITTGIDEFNCNFNLYRAEHPDMSAGEVIENYLSHASHSDAIADMLRNMQSVALPALIENIAARFVPARLRASEAPYIAAFQDKVLDYCEAYPSDIASFLTWWKSVGPKASISTPEGTDAVNIMTLHKAKGLEFPCVIVPADGYSFNPADHPETEWVAPLLPEGAAPDCKLPPAVPVLVTKALEGTPYAPLYRRYVDLGLADLLNMTYVAFTRAAEELYIYGRMPAKAKTLDIFEAVTGILARADSLADSSGLNIDPKALQCDGNGYTYGTLPAPCARKKEEEDDTIGEYTVNAERTQLIYQEETARAIDEEEEPDPRSMGNLMHDIMASIRTPDDLPRAILQVRTRGLANEAACVELRQKVESALAQPEVKRWFAPGLRVLNERTLLIGGGSDRRPDRIVIDASGHATVIDYKFGQKTDVAKYRNQVRHYAELLMRSGIARSAEGWIWYVAAGKTEQVWTSPYSR